MLNAISYLFEREDIPPVVIKSIMLYCLDCADSNGAPGKRGTSCSAMMFLSSWFNRFREISDLQISSRYLMGEDVLVEENGEITEALRKGGVAVVRLFDEHPHYVLFTDVKDEKIYLFDPYYPDDDRPDDVTVTLEHPSEYNHIVPFKYFNRENEELYSLGEIKKREAVLIFNTKESK
jgi:hypothetical protein